MAKRKKKVGQIGNIFRTEFSVIRLLENRLLSSVIEFSADLEIDDSAEAQDQMRTLECMRRWIDVIVNDSLVFCPTDNIPPALFKDLENNIMITPDEPYDHLLLVLICSKLNAIGSGIASISHGQLVSNLGDGFGNWFEGDTDDVLPTLTEWLGDRTYFDKPWWNRSDGSMIDIWAGPDDDITVKPDILVDLWQESSEDEIVEAQDGTAKIIKHNFKPTLN